MQSHVLITGGGIAGLTAGIALHQKGVDFLLVEAVPEIKALGSGITLAGNAMRILKKLHIDEWVKSKGNQITSMIIQDEKGNFISVMDMEKLVSMHDMYNIAIHRGALHEILLSQIPEEKILTGKKVRSVREENEKVTLTFEDGSEMAGSAMIAADGIHSVIRKQLVPRTEPRYSGYTCWRGLAENKWGITTEAYETWGPAGRFGYVPIGGKLIYWFACKNSSRGNDSMKRFGISDLADNFSRYPHPIVEIIQGTAEEYLIWNDIIDLKPLKQFAFSRVLLTGDAAHATTPNLGQGASLAIEDAWTVAEVISNDPRDITLAFRNFEKQRLARAQFIVNTSYRLGKIAQIENRLIARIRNSLFRIVPETVNQKQAEQILGIL